jgi:hypothetical protein
MHFNGKERYKSYAGGICTIIVMLIVIIITVKLAIPIIEKEKPYIQTLK